MQVNKNSQNFKFSLLNLSLLSGIKHSNLKCWKMHFLLKYFVGIFGGRETIGSRIAYKKFVSCYNWLTNISYLSLQIILNHLREIKHCLKLDAYCIFKLLFSEQLHGKCSCLHGVLKSTVISF